MRIEQNFAKVKPTVIGESEYGYRLIKSMENGDQTASIVEVERTGTFEVAIHSGIKTVVFEFKTLRDAKSMAKLLLKKD